MALRTLAEALSGAMDAAASLAAPERWAELSAELGAEAAHARCRQALSELLALWVETDGKLAPAVDDAVLRFAELDALLERDGARSPVAAEVTAAAASCRRPVPLPSGLPSAPERASRPARAMAVGGGRTDYGGDLGYDPSALQLHVDELAELSGAAVSLLDRAGHAVVSSETFDPGRRVLHGGALGTSPDLGAQELLAGSTLKHQLEDEDHWLWMRLVDRRLVLVVICATKAHARAELAAQRAVRRLEQALTQAFQRLPSAAPSSSVLAAPPFPELSEDDLLDMLA